MNNFSSNEFHLIAWGMDIMCTLFLCGVRRRHVSLCHSRCRLRSHYSHGAEVYASKREWPYKNTLHFIKFLLDRFSFHEISSFSPMAGKNIWKIHVHGLCSKTLWRQQGSMVGMAYALESDRHRSWIANCTLCLLCP